MRKQAAAVLAVVLCAACKKSAQQGGPAERAVPVTTARVEQKDVPIYLDGLGSVIAYRTVTVRPQVDGVLVSMPFREGQFVRGGDVLAQIDPRPFQTALHQAQGALERDQALLRSARLQMERDEPLLKERLISQQQFDQDKAAVGQYEGATGIDRAQIETAQLNLQWSTVRAPFDAVTGIRSVDPGNLVHATDATGIVVLTQLDPIAVIFTLPQDVLPQVAAQQQTDPLPVEVYGRDGATKLGDGKLEVIDNQINAGTATMRLKAVFANPGRKLWPNQFVKARLLLTTRKNAVVAPASSVQRGPDGTFVYVVQNDQTVQPRPVQIELTQANDTLFARGLNPGDVVVTEGQGQLKPGSKVAAKQPPGQQQQAGQPAAAQRQPSEVRGREVQAPRGREAAR
jgi:membrane fusion protein, multidrug efflux system